MDTNFFRYTDDGRFVCTVRYEYSTVEVYRKSTEETITQLTTTSTDTLMMVGLCVQ